MKGKEKHVSTSPVYVSKRTVLPPNAVCRIKCKMKDNLGRFLVESSIFSKCLIPRTLHNDTSEPVLSVVNCTDNFITLKKGQELAKAGIIDQVLPEVWIRLI